MALINCPECNREISDSALSCPQCGYHLRVREAVPVEAKHEQITNTSAVVVVIGIAAIFFIVVPIVVAITGSMAATVIAIVACTIGLFWYSTQRK